MLPAVYAPLVCDALQLPPGADPLAVYHGTAWVPAASPSPFVHVIWCSPASLDARVDAQAGTTEQQFRCLHTALGANVQAASTQPPSMQPASGVYHELGWGAMAGQSRAMVYPAGRNASVVPFRRNPELSARLAKPLGTVFDMCATVVHDILPPQLLRDHLRSRCACPQDVAAALQYPPATLPGAPPLLSHQVALRGVDETGHTAEVERNCLHAVADLHVDTCDGGAALGTVAIFWCSECPTPHDVADVLERLAYRDLAVFPTVTGGRGVRIGVLVPGWACIVCFRTSACLHGGISAVGPPGVFTPLPPLGLPEGTRAVRIITYPLAAIETLMLNLQDDAFAAAFVRSHLSP